MKQKLKPLLTVVLMSFVLIVSCKEQRIGDDQSSALTKAPPVITMPNVDWENEYLLLPNGQQIMYPWNEGSTHNLPAYVSNDYTKADGWVLVYNTVMPNFDNKYYFILYNKFKGIMRVFYYKPSSDVLGIESRGYWRLELTGVNAGSIPLLNNEDYFAKPITDKSTRFTTKSTLARDVSNFPRGWHAFDVEVTYAPTAGKDIKMSITPTAISYSELKVKGAFDAISTGKLTIANSGSVETVTNFGATAAGEVAKDWLNDKIKRGEIVKVLSGAIGDAVSGGVGGLIKSGVNLLFGSFLGRQSTSEYDLQFKTNGNIHSEGTIVQNVPASIMPINDLPLPASVAVNLPPLYDKQLGVWNLKSQPIVRTSRKAIFVGSEDDANGYLCQKTYDLIASSINVDFNPDLLSEIDSYTVESSLLFYEKFTTDPSWPTIIRRMFIQHHLCILTA